MTETTPKRKELQDLSYKDLVQCLESWGEKPYRATQIFEWLYRKCVWSPDDMKNLPKALRDHLAGQFILKPLKIADKQVSQDGTTKFLLELDDRQRIETVLIPSKTRTTVCLSTQAGCKFGCRFCASGIGGWTRNLSAAEIITQILHVKEEARKHKKPLSHIVYMGVGEPLDNFQNVMKSIRIVNDKRGLNIGARRIAVSTCGVIPRMKQLAQEGLQLELAISLHGYDNASRNTLMPVNRTYPFDDLMTVCREYSKETNRQITFEYILIKDVTCTDRAVQALRKAFKGVLCKMNLIPYNPVREFDFQAPSGHEISAFKERLDRVGIHATLRRPRGKDISGACGQLRTRGKA